MKKTMAIMSVAVLAGTMSASAGLIAGFDTWGSTAASGVQLDGVTATAAYGAPPWQLSGGAASTDGTFGSVTTPAASTANTLVNTGIMLPNGADGNMVFTITDTTGTARDLTTFHFDFTRFRFGSAENWVLSVTGGDLTNGDVESGTAGVFNTSTDLPDYDIDLTGLADFELDANGSVEFTLSFTGGNGAIGQHSYLDNVGVSSVPEPATLGLVAMMGGGIMFMRRRFTT